MTKPEMISKLMDAELTYPIPEKFDMGRYHSAGVIAKNDLKNHAYYFGLCRNAHIAMWDEGKDCFWYIRAKFSSHFAEDICHMEDGDDNNWDVFLPFKEIE